MQFLRRCSGCPHCPTSNLRSVTRRSVDLQRGASYPSWREVPSAWTMTWCCPVRASGARSRWLCCWASTCCSRSSRSCNWWPSFEALSTCRTRAVSPMRSMPDQASSNSSRWPASLSRRSEWCVASAGRCRSNLPFDERHFRLARLLSWSPLWLFDASGCTSLPTESPLHGSSPMEARSRSD